jgi:hypothetical protein
MNIINSEVISSDLDVFWNGQNENVKNLRHVSVLVITSAITSETQRALLLRMIAACGLAATDFAIVELADNTPVAWYRLREATQARAVLLFGVPLPALGISVLLKACEPNRFDNALWIPAPALAILEQDAELRKQLWQQGMKLVFIDHIYGNPLAHNHNS